MSLKTTHGGGLFDFIGKAVGTVTKIAPLALGVASHMGPLIAMGIHIRHIEKHMGIKHHMTPIEKKKYSNIKNGAHADRLEKDGRDNKINMGIDLKHFTVNDKKYLAELVMRQKRILEKVA